MSNRGVLRGFPGTKKEQTEPKTGLFYLWKSSTLIGSWEYGIRRYLRIHTCFGNEGFRQTPRHMLP